MLYSVVNAAVNSRKIIWPSLRIKGLFYVSQQMNDLLCTTDWQYTDEKNGNCGKLSWCFLFGSFWEVGTTTQESVICFHVLNWLFSTSLEFKKKKKKNNSALCKHMQLINIRKNWERNVTQLLQICLVKLVITSYYGRNHLFFVFSYCDFFCLFIYENAESFNANWRKMKII